MGEEGGPPLPACDRCHHFVARDRSVATCGPCRKAYQLGVSLRNVIPPGKDESAVVFLEGCFSLLQDWITEIKGLTEKEKAAKEKNGKGDPFVTPTPRTAKSKDKQSSSDSTRRGLTFGKNTIFDIRAENKAPEPNLRQADAILDGLKDFSSRCVDMATQSVEPSLHPATAPIP